MTTHTLLTPCELDHIQQAVAKGDSLVEAGLSIWPWLSRKVWYISEDGYLAYADKNDPAVELIRTIRDAIMAQ